MAIEPGDRAVAALAGNVRQAQAEALSNAGLHRAAIATQRDVIALYERGRAMSASGRLNRLVTSYVVLGGLARSAGDRELACRSYRDAERIAADLERQGSLLATAGRHRAKLALNIDRCGGGAPLSAMESFA